MSPQSLLPQEGDRKGSGVGSLQLHSSEQRSSKLDMQGPALLTLSVSPQSLLPQEHRRGSGLRRGEHLSIKGARPLDNGCAPS